MASDVLISYLPNEVLEYILESDIISVADVCNFGSTCTKFRSLVSGSNKLWKTKFLQRYVCKTNIFSFMEYTQLSVPVLNRVLSCFFFFFAYSFSCYCNLNRSNVNKGKFTDDRWWVRRLFRLLVIQSLTLMSNKVT
jgi:hypothetical protein